MKKSLLMKTMLLLFALVVGSTCAWATEVTYTISSKNTLTTTGTAPAGSSATIVETYNTSQQMTNGNSQTLTLKGYNGATISQLVLSMHSNKSSGSGRLSYSVDGGANFTYLVGTSNSGVQFNNAKWYGAWTQSFVDITKDVNIQCGTSDVIIKIEATANSLFCESYTLTYTADTRTNVATIGELGVESLNLGAEGTFSPSITPADGLTASDYNVTWEEIDNDNITLLETGEYLVGNKKGNVDVTVIVAPVAAKSEDYKSVSKTYTISIVDPNAGDGTEANPFTVAEAVEYIETLGSATSPTDVYVKGIISQIDSYNSTYKSITYWISDDGTTTGQMEVYSGKGLDGADFSSVSDLVVGADVVVKGKVKKYSGVCEFDKNNQLVSYDVPVHPTISAAPAALTGFTYAEGEGPSTAKSFSVSGTNLTANISLTASANYEISLAENSGYASNLELTQSEGAVAATTIYVRLKAGLSKGENNGTITLSSTGADNVVVTLTGNVTSDFASLPFEYDGNGTGTLPYGLTVVGTGTYNSSPKIKFDGTGDYVLLKINEAPGSLSFDIKGNGSGSDPWDGTFTVQTSADGETYTDLKEYTELGATMTEAFALASTVRYIKWVYTDKVTGNVALGNISLVADAEEVTVSAAGLATFASDSKLDFGNVTNLEAYIAKENKGKIELVQVNKVAAGTGVLLRALNSATEFKVPVTAATAEATTGNLFVRGAGAAVASEDGGKYNYVLGKHNGEVGFYKAGGMTVATDKAYIQTSISSARIAIDFDEMDVTGISEIETMRNVGNETFYNLNGQKVQNPTKGLYIMNGRKVIIK